MASDSKDAKITELEREIRELKQQGELKEKRALEEQKKKFEKQEVECLAYRTSNERRWSDIRVLITRPQELDICFLIDATGSMEATLTDVIAQIGGLSSGITDAYPDCDLMMSFVIYRDTDTQRTASMVCPFTTDFRGGGSLFMDSLNAVEAVGGDDAAEDVLPGLREVANLNWRATKNRLLVHIGDAPCHGKGFHHLASGGDSKLEVNETEVRQVLDQLRIVCRVTRYLFLHVNHSTKRMVAKFRELVADSPLRSIPMPQPPKSLTPVSITGIDDWIQEFDFVYAKWHTKIVEASTELISLSIDAVLFLSYILSIAKLPIEPKLPVPLRPHLPPELSKPKQPVHDNPSGEDASATDGGTQPDSERSQPVPAISAMERHPAQANSQSNSRRSNAVPVN